MLWMLMLLLERAHAQDVPLPADRVAFVDGAITDIKDAINTLEKMMAQAGDDKEFMECLKQKLPMMQILLSISEQSKTEMQKAVLSGDIGQADLEMRKINVAQVKVREFLDQAYACMPANGRALVEVHVTGPTEGFIDIVDNTLGLEDRFVLPETSTTGTPY